MVLVNITTGDICSCQGVVLHTQFAFIY